MQIGNFGERVLSNIMLKPHSQNSHSDTRKVTPAEIKAVIDYTFAELLPLYPYWNSIFDSKNALRELKRSWAKAFTLNGIFTFEQVDLGLKKAYLTTSDYLPSATKFISWCKPEPVTAQSMGLPENLIAFRLACQHANNILFNSLELDNTPEIIRMAVQHSGLTLILEGTEAARKRFDYEYESLIFKLASGEDLSSENVSPLPSPKTVSYSKTDEDIKAASLAMKKIKELLR